MRLEESCEDSSNILIQCIEKIQNKKEENGNYDSVNQ
jgi:hypothetical protein